jgi:hypothetical protein
MSIVPENSACFGKWGDWTPCDATCDGVQTSNTGKQKRTYTITTPINDKLIKTIETDAPCTKLCNVDCIEEYGKWGDCDAICKNNEGTSEGIKKRTYTIKRPANNGGKACTTNPILEEKCTKPCPINCVGEWSNWSECETSGSTCTGQNPFNTGKKKRTYKIITQNSNDGTKCEKEDGAIEEENCQKECSVDNMFYIMTIAFGGTLAAIVVFGAIYWMFFRKKNTPAPIAVSNSASGKKVKHALPNSHAYPDQSEPV